MSTTFLFASTGYLPSHGMEVPTMTEKPAMLVLAEMAMSKREIEAVLYEKAEEFIRRKAIFGRSTDRQTVVAELWKVVDSYAWSNFQRKKTIERVARRACERNGVYLKRAPRPIRNKAARESQE